MTTYESLNLTGGYNDGPGVLDRLKRAHKRWPQATLQTHHDGVIAVTLQGDWTFLVWVDGSYDTGKGGARAVGRI